MTAFLIAIDPGVSKGHGIALFHGSALQWARIGAIEDVHVIGAHKAIIEFPVAPNGRASRGDTNDLLDLCFEIGRVFQYLHGNGVSPRKVLPVEWKGSIPKEVSFRRVWKELTPRERENVFIPGPARVKLDKGQNIGKSLAGDVLDAVGLGLWQVGRINTRAR